MNQMDNDPSHWKLGIFYFNRNDKRIFPPKRLGFGWTVNFGNPLSVAVFVLIFLMIALVSRLSR